MSYIRSGSNPEGLYIFGGRNNVEIFASHNHPCKKIPYAVWNKFCAEYGLYDDDEGIEIDGFFVKSDWVDDADGHNYKTILGYKDEWSIAMWDVTWAYIVRSAHRVI